MIIYCNYGTYYDFVTLFEETKLRKRIETNRIRLRIRKENISWIERKTHVEVLGNVGEKRTTKQGRQKNKVETMTRKKRKSIEHLKTMDGHKMSWEENIRKRRGGAESMIDELPENQKVPESPRKNHNGLH